MSLKCQVAGGVLDVGIGHVTDSAVIGAPVVDAKNRAGLGRLRFHAGDIVHAYPDIVALDDRGTQRMAGQ